MQGRSFNWVVALVGIGLSGVVAVSAATALASRSAASPLEIRATDRFVCDSRCDLWDGGFPNGHVGEFTSGAPFCDSGATVLIEHVWLEVRRRYTCTDGSGSLTLSEQQTAGRPEGPGGEWTIVEGSGRYADLRAEGSYSAEYSREGPDSSEGPVSWVVRTTFRGFDDADAVAPSAAFTSARAIKLSRLRPAGEYEVRVTLSLGDDVEGNTVAYRLRVMEGARSYPFDRPRRELAREEGSSASDSVSTSLRVYPSSKRVRNVVLLLNASDPVGNEVSLVRVVKLPR